MSRPRMLRVAADRLERASWPPDVLEAMRVFAVEAEHERGCEACRRALHVRPAEVLDWFDVLVAYDSTLRDVVEFAEAAVDLAGALSAPGHRRPCEPGEVATL
ncbi:hypothetical protein [Actinomycetospora flava]|uniref:Uncharacterized protein n=1 Tax=Actinomycetospora flava TaxID=3129232 RepID=A0ABU8M142_9PSEU